MGSWTDKFRGGHQGDPTDVDVDEDHDADGNPHCPLGGPGGCPADPAVQATCPLC